MSYLYVKAGLGTCVSTAGRLTQQTGAFGSGSLTAGNVYANISSAFTNGAPVSGDFIMVSDAHSHDYGAADQSWVGPSSGAFLSIASVADANADQSAKATVFQENCAWYMGVSGRVYFYGLWLKTSTALRNNSADSQFIFDECVLEVAATNAYPLRFAQHNSSMLLSNCEIKGISGGDFAIGLFDGATFEMYGGSVTGITDTFVAGPSNYGGTRVNLVGVDLSSITGHIVENIGTATTDESTSFEMLGCKTNASLTGFWQEAPVNHGHRLTASNCGSSSASGEYQWHTTRFGGVVDEETSITRSASTPFSLGTPQKISLKCTTNSAASAATPFWFYAPTRYAALSDTASDVIRIYLVCSTTLADNDVWAEAVYPDGISNNQYNFISSRNTDIFSTATALDTDTVATWDTAPVTPNYYQIDLDTSVDAGADSVPQIRVYVAKPSTTIYFCPTLGLS